MNRAVTVGAVSNEPPPPLPEMAAKSKHTGLTVFLSIVLGLFGLSAVISFLDDSLLAIFAQQNLTVIRVLILLLMLPVGLITYLMLAIRPGIPKRAYLPVALFLPVSVVAVLPLLVYYHVHAAWIGWGVSALQLLVAACILRWLKSGSESAWSLVAASRLTEKSFSWTHFTGMILTGLLVLLPALVLYTAFSAKLAVGHFSAGFVKLTPAGISMEVRDYIRDDGKKVTLVPMSHIADSTFYENIAVSFPPDSLVLMEGVSDHKKLIKTASNYSKMAQSIGVVEQQKVFKPEGEVVAADIDISDLSPETLDLLKAVMLLHSKGVTAETMPTLMKPTPPGLEKRLMVDILDKRNEHLLKVLYERLPDSKHIIVPWGAAHMPGISHEIENAGFRVVATHPFMAIRFAWW